jgi:hypothetical protein
MIVTETINVQAKWENIKHGIYRDFPTRYKDKYGNNCNVDFEIISVEKDGQPEPYHTKVISNGTRIYIGDEDILIPPNKYAYRITYKTNRQIGFYNDHDELYWNVTGNGWIFPIEEVYAFIELPEDAKEQILSMDAFTGRQGSREKDFVTEKDTYGNILFSTTRPLGQYEGLTIFVSWPKGFICEPTKAVKAGYFLRDNTGTIIGIMGFVIVISYYLAIWSRVGKDPKKGVIIPLFAVPENLSPASMRYISKMGYDHKTFAASAISMAVKGFLKITEDKRGYILVKENKTYKTGLSEEEREIYKTIFSKGAEIELKAINHELIRKTIDVVKSVLKNKCERVYFVTNIKYFLIGVFMSLAFALFALTSFKTEAMPNTVFVSIWLTGWSFGIIFLIKKAVSQWKYLIVSKWVKWFSIIEAFFSTIFVTIFVLPFVVGEIIGLFLFAKATSPFFAFVFFLTIVANIVFYYLLKAPTLLGRRVLDKIEGFKMFLSVAEKERLNILSPPEKTPELFEKFLPYALALDVENKWAQQFSAVLLQTSMEGKGYSPAWYSGSSWSSYGTGDFTSLLGSSFSGAIASSSTAPGSSSGGGGGSSGGGGGGGGGGGW